MTRATPKWSLLLVALAMTGGCIGYIGDRLERDQVPPAADTQVEGVGKLGIRRLTRTEYIHTVHDLVDVDIPEAFTYLPDDPAKPFDNDYTSQKASAALIESVQQLAEIVADRVLEDAARRDAVVGCAPAGPDDASCMQDFIEHFGRRVLRRPLTDDDIASFLALQSYAHDAGDFYEGVRVALRAMFQHPEFLYRIEFGTPVAGSSLRRLDAFEVATRLSYFLQGTTPDDALLDVAASNQLSTPAEVRAAATRLVESPQGRDQVQRFHAAWLGYAQLQAPSAELMKAMQSETTALLDRVVFERHDSWLELFRSSETFINDDLAEIYDLPAPGSSTPQWVDYGTSERRGILSHASFLSNGIKFGDTSPTQRGKLIRVRLMCGDIPPPPADVKKDEPPKDDGGGHCKLDGYKAHAKSPTCNSCHSLMDPLGFGLENYDGEGRYRTTEPASADCPIDGQGEMVGVGQFHGPAELGELLIQSGTLQSCIVRQVYRFAWGRTEALEDGPYLDALTEKFRDTERFDELLLDLVGDEAFGYRIEE